MKSFIHCLELNEFFTCVLESTHILTSTCQCQTLATRLAILMLCYHMQCNSFESTLSSFRFLIILIFYIYCVMIYFIKLHFNVGKIPSVAATEAIEYIEHTKRIAFLYCIRTSDNLHTYIYIFRLPLKKLKRKNSATAPKISI